MHSFFYTVEDLKRPIALDAIPTLDLAPVCVNYGLDPGRTRTSEHHSLPM